MSNSSSSSNGNVTGTHKLPSDFKTLTFTVPCPSCGADVEFASTASVMAVCEYCQTTVVRDGEEVTSQGKQSLTIEDYSPLQIGSFGNYQKNTFVVVGRIQYQYTEGIWNEWYIQFANGHNGWLSEALGQYSLTLNKGINPELPSYDDLWINQAIDYDGTTYNVSDKRTAHAIAGEGELPFVMGSGFQTWVADARYQRQFITLDYAQQGTESAPTVFKGISVSLEHLNMQMLKTNEQINKSANQSSGAIGADGQSDDISKIDCPNCGSPVPYVAGVTNCLLCPACHSEVQLTGNHAEVVQIHSMMQHWKSSLELGAKARIKERHLDDIGQFSSTDVSTLDDKFSTAGKPINPSQPPKALSNKYNDYIVIGIQRMQEVGSYARWTEYLLYSFTDGFLWLSEEPKRGWMVSRVVNDFPTKSGSGIQYDGRFWNNRDGDYQSRVVFAIGAFNWQVNVNDYMTLTDYINGDDVITAEQNDSEITYTIASPVADTQMQTWFGSQLKQLENTSEDFGQYKREDFGGYSNNWDDDDWDDDDFSLFSLSSFFQVLIGLAFGYFFLFLGSVGAFFLSVIMAIVALVIFVVITNPYHGYESIGSIFSEVIDEDRTLTKVIAWGLVVLTIVMNGVIFGFNSSSSTGAGYYSSGSSGRTGYSSSGSHK